MVIFWALVPAGAINVILVFETEVIFLTFVEPNKISIPDSDWMFIGNPVPIISTICPPLTEP